MKIIYKSKYLEIEFNLRSWGIAIDWYNYENLRPVGFQILCFSIEVGQDPYPEEETDEQEENAHVSD